MAGPMEGVRVIELGVWVAGPAAGCILADWGADVVKVEPPGLGDPARSFSKMLGADLPFNPPFEMDNRNKRSLVLDLTSAEGREIADALFEKADVFVTNIRRQALSRLGLDPESLCKRFPRLIYSEITGYGREGPDANRAAYDIAAFWARSGVAASLTQPDGQPPFQRGGMGDHNTGLAAAGSISAALFAREKTGSGQLVSTSLLREGMYTMSFDMALTLRYGVDVQVANRKAMGNPCINSYQDSEGNWFWIVGLEADRHWPPLARLVGHPEWVEDERFSSIQSRQQNASTLIALLDEIFATKTLAEWTPIFEAEPEMFWSPVQTIADVIQDEQAHAAGGFVEIPDGEGTTILPATPVDFHGTPIEHRNMAPEAGQDSEAILGEIGLSGEQIKSLREKGVLG
ncbi:MAG: CoA transferase [Deltaproteobacteria bacterium]|nr:CoA transferase [Deltaproteobacteria bacterium]